MDSLRTSSGKEKHYFDPDFEAESGIEAGILEEKRFSSHLWIRFLMCWAAFVVVALFWQGDKNL